MYSLTKRDDKKVELAFTASLVNEIVLEFRAGGSNGGVIRISSLENHDILLCFVRVFERVCEDRHREICECMITWFQVQRSPLL